MLATALETDDSILELSSPAEAEVPPSRAGILFGIAAFCWLALSAAILLLIFRYRSAAQLDILEWGALTALITAPLGLIGTTALLWLRFHPGAGANQLLRAQSLLNDASVHSRREIERLSAAVLALRSRVDEAMTGMESKLHGVGQAGDTLAARMSAVGTQLHADAQALERVGRIVEGTAGTARSDFGVLLSDLPELEERITGLSTALQRTQAELTGAIDRAAERVDEMGGKGSMTSDALDAGAERLLGRIEALEAGAAALREQLTGADRDMNVTIDAALERLAEAMEATRSAIETNAAALTGHAERAQTTLGEAARTAAGALSTEISAIEQSADQAVARLEDQRAVMAGNSEAMEEALSGLDIRLADTAQSGGRILQDLQDRIDGIRLQTEALQTPMSDGQAETGRWLERLGAVRAAMDGIADAVEGALSPRLLSLDALVAQAGSSIALSGEMLADFESRLADARETAQQIADIAAQGPETLNETAEKTDRIMGTLREQIAALRAELDGIESASSDVSLKASSSLIEALGRIRETAAQATASARSSFEGLADQAREALAEASRESLRSAVDEPIAERIAALKAQTEAATEAAQASAERLARQMVRIVEMTATLETAATQAEAHIEAATQEEFSKRSALLIEALNSSAIDIAKALSADISDTAWAAYLKGDRSVFTRRAVRLLGSGEARDIARIFEEDPEFREQANRYIHDFEAMTRRVLTERGGGPMAVALLSSDSGKLYVALDQALEKRREN